MEYFGFGPDNLLFKRRVPVSYLNSCSSFSTFGMELYRSQNVSFAFAKILTSISFHTLIFVFKSSLNGFKNRYLGKKSHKKFLNCIQRQRYGPYYMNNIICSILYGPYHMVLITLCNIPLD